MAGRKGRTMSDRLAKRRAGYVSPPRPELPSFELRSTNSGTKEIMRQTREKDDRAAPCRGFASEQCNLNRSLHTECERGACDNRLLQRRQFPETAARPTPSTGWGLYAVQRILEGQLVEEYVGELIHKDTFWERFEEWQHHQLDPVYYCHLYGLFVLDATKKGSYARFVNHSCNPNTAYRPFSVAGRRRIGLVALRDITPDEEVTASYQFEDGCFTMTCDCGHRGCSGWVHRLPAECVAETHDLSDAEQSPPVSQHGSHPSSVVISTDTESDEPH
mmetsp:Transcript_48528/g.99079  ORF Transcript_48528/g.99079 Transcript_48528/m.99079 type:complete len:275 (-) Transcript_48528:11-835(-)